MEYLDDTQLGQFQTALASAFSLQRQTVTNILLSSPHSSHNLAATKLDGLSSDELIELIQRIDLQTLSAPIKEMIKIDAAFNNMQIGMYGLCSDCEEPISLERLKNDPTIQRCNNCAGKYQQQKYNHYRL